MDQIVLVLVHVVMADPVTPSLENVIVQQDGKVLLAKAYAHQELTE
jgi:hypothetical protein